MAASTRSTAACSTASGSRSSSAVPFSAPLLSGGRSPKLTGAGSPRTAPNGRLRSAGRSQRRQQAAQRNSEALILHRRRRVERRGGAREAARSARAAADRSRVGEALVHTVQEGRPPGAGALVFLGRQQPMLLEQHLGAPVAEVGEHDDDQLVPFVVGLVGDGEDKPLR